MSARVPASDLLDFTRRAFEACGLEPNDADAGARALAYADLVGMDGHGVVNLERIYVPRLLSGSIRAQGRPRTVAEAAAAVHIDADGALGLVAATLGIDAAIERARRCGVGAAVVSNSTHMGPAGYYVRRAVDRGMLAIATTNLGTQSIAPPPGGETPVLGTNPISAGSPALDEPPFLLDMSTTVVSTGRVRVARRRGESIPPGWLVAPDGAPVTDPAAYDAGEANLAWLGGTPATGAFKGFGLALLVEILAGVLPGAATAPDARRGAADGAPADRDIGHFFLAIDVEAFRPLADYRRHMDSVLAAVRAAGAGASYPGVPETATERERRATGIPLDDELRRSLERVAERLAIAPARVVPALAGEPRAGAVPPAQAPDGNGAAAGRVSAGDRRRPGASAEPSGSRANDPLP